MHNLLAGHVQGIVAIRKHVRARLKFGVQAQIKAVVSAVDGETEQAGNLAVQVFQRALDMKGIFFLVFVLEVSHHDVTDHYFSPP